MNENREKPKAQKNPQESDGSYTTLRELVELGSRRHFDAARPACALRPPGAGPYRSAFRGGGIEFDEVREYQPGDDVRAMDWRVTARTGRPHTRVFHEDRESPVWLMVDAGVGMRFGTRVAFKSVVAARTAALFAWSARERGDRVGGIVRATDGVCELPPRLDESAFFGLLGAMARATEAHGDRDPEPFERTLERLARAARTGSRVYLISDFDSLGEDGERHLEELARRTDLTCVMVYDALEASAPPPGRYGVSDGDEFCAIDIDSGRWREEWEAAFAARWQHLSEFCIGRRVGLVPLRTDSDPAAAVARALGKVGAPRRRAA